MNSLTRRTLLPWAAGLTDALTASPHTPDGTDLLASCAVQRTAGCSGFLLRRQF